MSIDAQAFCVVQVIYDDAGQAFDYRYVEASPDFESQIGMPDALGRSARELVPEIEPSWIETMGRVALTGQSARFTKQAKSTGRWFDAYAFRLRGPDQTGRVGVMFNDITGRQAAEAALAAQILESERQRRLYETIISSTPDLVYAFGPDYRFTFVNAALLAMWGRTLEDSLGKRLLEVGYEPWHAAMHEREIDCVVSTKQPIRGEVHFPHASLGTRVYDYIFVPVFDTEGEVEHIVGTTRDVTERCQAEREQQQLLKKVQAEQTRLAELFEHAPSFMCEFRGPHHVFVRANEQLLRLVNRGDVLGKTLHDVVPSADGAAIVACLDQVFQTGDPLRSTVQVTFEPDGPDGPDAKVSACDDGAGERWLDLVFQPIRDAEQVIIGVFVQGLDFTERMRAETALKKVNRRKDEFLATLAHELRNPLAAISAAVGAIPHVRDEPGRLGAMTSIIQRQSSQIVRLVDDLVDINRIARGKVELECSRVDLADVVRQGIEGVRHICDSKQIRLALELPDRPMRIDVDPIRVAQVCANLVHNAAKFTEPGGEVRIGVAREASQAVIVVRDTGIGILPEDLGRIFGMFAQIGDADGRSGGGLGVGLALARSIVALHGGTLEARSDGAGQGAEFIVRIPIVEVADCDPAPFDGHAGVAATRDPGRGARILIVDDDDDAREAVTETMRILGHVVVAASSGREALDNVRVGTFDMILVDIGMPGMDGYEVARRIRCEPRSRDVTLVAMTGWAQPGDQDAAFAAGFDAHLTKPADPGAIDALLAQRPRRVAPVRSASRSRTQ